MNAPVKTDLFETHESVFEILTAWLLTPGKCRELKVESNPLGLFAKLYESGMLQATGRGTSSDDAIADALSNALVIEGMEDPDAAENEWNRANGGGR